MSRIISKHCTSEESAMHLHGVIADIKGADHYKYIVKERKEIKVWLKTSFAGSCICFRYKYYNGRDWSRVTKSYTYPLVVIIYDEDNGIISEIGEFEPTKINIINFVDEVGINNLNDKQLKNLSDLLEGNKNRIFLRKKFEPFENKFDYTLITNQNNVLIKGKSKEFILREALNFINNEEYLRLLNIYFREKKEVIFNNDIKIKHKSDLYKLLLDNEIIRVFLEEDKEKIYY